MSKKNIFIKKILNLLLSINNRIESFFNFLKQLRFNKKKILDKKIIIPSAVLVFSILVYLILPSFYDKIEVKNQIKNQIFQNYNLKINSSKELKYGFFPKPHFLIDNVEIEYNSKIISNSKKVKFYISIKDNFKFNEVELDDLIFLETVFRVDLSNFNFFFDLLKNKISNQNIKFIKNKLFYLDQNEEVIFFSDIEKLDFLYQENSINELVSKLEIFALPVGLNIKHDISNNKILNQIKINQLRLNIENEFNYTEKDLDGLIKLNLANKNQIINYSLKDNTLSYNLKDQSINGEVNIKPFYLSSNLNINNTNFKDLFGKNSILISLIKSEIFNNKNLNGNIIVSLKKLNDFRNIDLLNFEVMLEEGQIFIANLNFIFKDSAIFNFNNVNTINEDNKLKFIGDIQIVFKNIQKFYNHFQIEKNNRKNINQINSNFIFNYDDQSFVLNELKVSEVNNEILDQDLNQFNSGKQNILNEVLFKNKVRDFFKLISLD
jgi:hypothetical protein